MSGPTERSHLVSVDGEIDAIAREALKEARRVEEALRYRSNPGPIVAPDKPPVAPTGLSSEIPEPPQDT